MEHQSYVNKKVIKKDGSASYIVTEKRTSFGTFIVLEDKTEYNLEAALKSGAITVVDEPTDSQDLQDIVDEAVKLFNGTGRTSAPFRENGDGFDKLMFGKRYGTNASEIYLRCCRALNFDSSKKGHFGPQKKLYATNATPENYSAWMLPNNTYTGKHSGEWANVFRGDLIYEVHKDLDPGDTATRVTFAKQYCDAYVFMGVYAFEKRINYSACIDGIQINFIKVYKRIAKTYPQ